MHNFYGLGQDAQPMPMMVPDSLQSEIDGFLLRAPAPSSSDVASFLKLYPSGDDRNTAAQALITRGVDPSTVAAALNFLDTSGSMTKSKLYGLLSLASAAFSGFHGVRRNHGSVGWGLWWFAVGGIFPVVTPVIALAQGYAQPQVRS